MTATHHSVQKPEMRLIQKAVEGKEKVSLRKSPHQAFSPYVRSKGTINHNSYGLSLREASHVPPDIRTAQVKRGGN
jgi:hypothetical protein